MAALCSLAYAKAPQGPRFGGGAGGGAGGGFAHAGFPHPMRGFNGAGPGARVARAAPAAPVDRNPRMTRGVAGAQPGVRNGYNAPQGEPQRMAGGGAYRGENGADLRSGGYQYAGAITTVSAETRSVPRPPEDESMVRAGSIRADVARYNEERGATRPVPRPPDDYMQRPPPPSPYRN
jgi:hypothetical protein